ncbi:MAG TPA: CHRD domain-containing protein [Candidatus Limnocylindria bacterium]|nr:CHRD domain-containing protein [Candidatus Limnocylindria bacterium]
MALAATLMALTLGGALAAGGGRTISVPMTGAQEPGGGDPDAMGTATFTINVGQETLCYTLSWTGIGGTTPSTTDDPIWGGHIHQAPLGVAGGIAIHLFGAPMEPRTAFGSTATVSDCMTVPREQLVELFANLDDYYINIHNDEFPGGAIRGQLR